MRVEPDAERLGELARARAELAPRARARAAPASRSRPRRRLERADQDRSGLALAARRRRSAGCGRRRRSRRRRTPGGPNSDLVARRCRPTNAWQAGSSAVVALGLHDHPAHAVERSSVAADQVPGHVVDRAVEEVRSEAHIRATANVAERRAAGRSSCSANAAGRRPARGDSSTRATRRSRQHLVVVLVEQLGVLARAPRAGSPQSARPAPRPLRTRPPTTPCASRKGIPCGPAGRRRRWPRASRPPAAAASRSRSKRIPASIRSAASRHSSSVSTASNSASLAARRLLLRRARLGFLAGDQGLGRRDGVRLGLRSSSRPPGRPSPSSGRGAAGDRDRKRAESSAGRWVLRSLGSRRGARPGRLLFVVRRGRRR